MSVLAIFVTWLGTHSGTVVGVSTFILAQLGNTMPDMGTSDFYKLWAHDFFKAITASTKKK
jgi:hypothetical protein